MLPSGWALFLISWKNSCFCLFDLSKICPVYRESNSNFQTRWGDNIAQLRQQARETQTTHQSGYWHSTGHTTYTHPNSFPWQVQVPIHSYALSTQLNPLRYRPTLTVALIHTYRLKYPGSPVDCVFCIQPSDRQRKGSGLWFSTLSNLSIRELHAAGHLQTRSYQQRRGLYLSYCTQ